MKTNAVIIQKQGHDVFFGFMSDNPAICAQSNSLQGVKDSLVDCAKLYHAYMSKAEFEIESEQLLTL